MITMIVIFDISFALRLISDRWTMIVFRDMDFTFWSTLNALVAPFVLDLVPICCILYIHTSNFRLSLSNGDDRN